MKRRLFGDEHSSLADSYNNLAALEADRKNYAGALEMYQRTLELDRKSLGEDHPYVHTDLVGVGVMQSQLGRLDEAEATLKLALEGIRRGLRRGSSSGLQRHAGAWHYSDSTRSLPGGRNLSYGSTHRTRACVYRKIHGKWPQHGAISAPA